MKILVYQYYRIVFRAPRWIENLSRSIKLKIWIEIIYVWGNRSTFDFINIFLPTRLNSSPWIFRLTTLFTSDVLIDSPTYLRPTSRDLPSEREFQRVGRTIILKSKMLLFTYLYWIIDNFNSDFYNFDFFKPSYNPFKVFISYLHCSYVLWKWYRFGLININNLIRQYNIWLYITYQY